jgi:HK97 gp10 family phage protein
MLKSRIPQIIVEIQVIAEESTREGAETVRDSAELKLQPHRLSGRLAEATHVERDEDENGYAVVAGDRDVFWGHFLEHGTSHSAAYPFLVPSLEENRKEIVDQARRRLARL